MTIAQLKQSCSAIADWLESKLFAGQRRITRKEEDPVPKDEWVPKLNKLIEIFFACMISAGLVVGFIYAVYYYSSTLQQIESHPLVTNLKRQNVPVFIKTTKAGEAIDCGEQSAGCWSALEEHTSASTQTHEGWQVHEFPLKLDFKKMASDDQQLIYYKFVIEIPQNLRASDREIAFTPIFVAHREYEVFLNGRLVQSGMAVGASDIVVVSIPRTDISDGQAVIGIQAKVYPDDAGITHPHGVFVGPKNVIQEAFVFQERALFTYFLLFLLSKGSIFIVFTLFLIFSIDRRALFQFLIYAFCVTAENFISGNFFAKYLDIDVRVVIFYSLKTVAICALMMFFVEFFQAARSRKYVRRGIVLLISLVLLMDFDLLWGSKFVSGLYLYHLTNALLCASLMVGITMGLLAIRLWKKANIESRKISRLVASVVMLSLYLALIVWESYFNEFVGFDKRAVFDLMFFYFIAFITAKEFGFNAGQVLTLESHMREKERMEMELQEAAEIAKAFIPGSAPAWPFCDMSVFHRSLSESSGDWYTFEESQSGRFGHLLMCDITGHGVQAALVVSACRTVLSALRLEKPDCVERVDFITDYAHALNYILFHQGAGLHVTTLLGLTFDTLEKKLYYVSAGHPNPLLIQKGGARPQIKPLTSRCTVLGTRETLDIQLGSIDYKEGDEILAFTDGLPLQAHIKVTRSFLTQGVSLADSPHALYQAIWREELEKKGKEPDDDVSIVWFKMSA